jgi:hypothetical protein
MYGHVLLKKLIEFLSIYVRFTHQPPILEVIMEDKILFTVLTLGSVAHYCGSATQGPLTDSSYIVLTGWVSNGKFLSVYK